MWLPHQVMCEDIYLLHQFPDPQPFPSEMIEGCQNPEGCNLWPLVPRKVFIFNALATRQRLKTTNYLLLAEDLYMLRTDLKPGPLQSCPDHFETHNQTLIVLKWSKAPRTTLKSSALTTQTWTTFKASVCWSLTTFIKLSVLIVALSMASLLIVTLLQWHPCTPR